MFRPKHNPLIIYTNRFIINPILPTDRFLFFNDNTMPIISVPPPDAELVNTRPEPKPAIIPPTKVDVIISLTVGVVGIGINDKNIVCIDTHHIVLIKKVLLTFLYAIMNNGIFSIKFIYIF